MSKYNVAGVFLMLCVAVSLSGCGPSDEDAGVGGLTVGEARALNEAAAVVDARAENTAAALQAGQ